MCVRLYLARMASETTVRRGSPGDPQTDLRTAVEFRGFIGCLLRAGHQSLSVLTKASGLSISRLYAVASDENVKQAISVENATSILCAALVEGLIVDADQFRFWWRRLNAFLPPLKSLADYMLEECQVELERHGMRETRAKRDAYRAGIERGLQAFQLAESDEEFAKRLNDYDRAALLTALYAAKGRQTDWEQ